MAEIQNLIYKSECVLSTIRTLLYTQFTEKNLMEVEKKVKGCLEEYCDHLIQVIKGETMIPENDVIFLDEIFFDIFADCRKMLPIYERQKVIEKFQLIKQKFFLVSTMDTCKNYVMTLEKEAELFKKELKDSKYLKICCLDLLDELKDFIKRIKKARKNVKLQVGLEAATGVLTLGTAAASGAMGVVGAVARTGSATANGVTAAGNAATAVGGAAKCVAKTSKVATVAVEAIDTAGSSSGLPASKSIAVTIISNKGTKYVLDAFSKTSGIIKGAANVADLLTKTNIENKQKKFKKAPEEICFSVSKKVLYLQDSFVEDPNFCSTVLAIAIFEHVTNI